jgi:protein-disulfide isomerase
MAEPSSISDHDGKPVSLRSEAAYQLAPTAPRQLNPLTFLSAGLAVMAFVLALLAFSAGSGDDDSLNKDDVRSIVQQAVGTQIAGLPMADGAISQGEMQQMIDNVVNTQVAALIPTNTPIPPTPTIIPVGVAEQDDAFRGPEDAPVVIVEFSDFQCGYCGRWYQQTLPLILEAYPTEVKFVYRDFPIFGDDSLRAAMATECAEDQGKFWEMHNRLFDRAVNQEQVSLSQETLVSYAGELGMDTRSFGECLSSDKYREEVLADYQAATDYKLRGTPGFVINGVVYAIGAQPFDVFDGIIRSELAKQQQGG